jgi:hypothetical protein
MNESDLRQRLDALTASLSGPPVLQQPIDDETDGADAQRIATTQVDELLRRVAVLTGMLGTGNGTQWDEIDQLAARLLMADLGAIASTIRALNGLAGAISDLVAARREAERSASEPR